MSDPYPASLHAGPDKSSPFWFPCQNHDRDGDRFHDETCTSCGSRGLWACPRRRLIGHYVLEKAHKRLWIRDTHRDERVYTPPEFIEIVNRSSFDDLLEELNLGRNFIDAIIAFERSARIKSGYPGRSKQDRARRSLPSP